MNTSVGLNIAKYKAKVKNTDSDSYNSTYTEYPITENEYAKLKLAIADKEPFTWLHDLDGNRLREINAKRDIKEFLPIIHSKTPTRYSIICEFGLTHPVHNGTWDCKCSNKYGCIGVMFIEKLNKSLGLNVSSKYDLTDTMRQNYLNNLK